MRHSHSVLRYSLFAAVAAAASFLTGAATHAAPYASGITNNGSLVNFVLNEPADYLIVSVNNGPALFLDGSSKGTKSFPVSSLTDTFTITAYKNDSVGYTIPTGGTVAAAATGLSQTSNLAGSRLISDDSSILNRFPNPRGVDVVKNPSAANFGQTYIANSTPATTTTGARPVGRGVYALNADGTDAYGNGNTAVGNALWDSAASGNSPFRVTAGPDGSVYVTGFGDNASNVWRLSPNLNSVNQLFAGNTGPTALPAGQNHGSIATTYVTGTYGSDLTVYTIDEDMAGNRFGAGPTTLNNLWQYNLGTDTSLSTVTPTRINQAQVLLNGATTDLDRGADGKWYLNQNRSAGNEPGLVVLDATGAKIYDSLADSRALLGNPTAVDILRNIVGIAVSPDQKWIAGLINNSDIAVIPLVNGLPDLANRMVVDTGTDVVSGRDIAFDAAGNIHYVSSGQQLYRTFAPGGLTAATTSWNGASYAFAVGVPEPTTLSLLGLGALAATARRRRA